jgi:hypothetical protein
MNYSVISLRLLWIVVIFVDSTVFMSSRRDNFSAKVKQILGSRVAYRCCFPSCGILTIGPKSVDDTKRIILGEAAHIHGASPLGPRYDEKMTPEERSSFANGIWMCPHHAKLIDADKDNYSAETIRQWKQLMEAETYRQLRDLTKAAISEPTTIICLHPKLMFEGIWKGVEDDTWRFVVKQFIYGDLNALREFQVSRKGEQKDYVIVESQGDGRLIQDTFKWTQTEQGVEVAVKVLPSAIRRNPNFIGSAPSMREPILENGRWRLVAGKELAIQKISFLLNFPHGTRLMNRGYGTLFGVYYRDHADNPELLNRLIKVELTRLISIPTNPEQPAGAPDLNFINRIHQVKVGAKKEGSIPLTLSLEWGDGSFWEGIVDIHVGDSSMLAPTDLLPFRPVETLPSTTTPLADFKTLTTHITGEELQISKNEESVIKIFKVVLPQIMDKAIELLEAEIFPRFSDHTLSRTFDQSTFDYLTSYDLEMRLLKGGMIHQMGIHLKLKGYKKAGIRAFDVYGDLQVFFNDYNYTIGLSQAEPWLVKLYHQLLTPQEVENVANGFIDTILRRINENLLRLQ